MPQWAETFRALMVIFGAFMLMPTGFMIWLYFHTIANPGTNGVSWWGFFLLSFIYYPVAFAHMLAAGAYLIASMVGLRNKGYALNAWATNCLAVFPVITVAAMILFNSGMSSPGR